MNPVPETLASLTASIRQALPLGPRVYLRFGACTLEVQTNREELVTALNRYFRSFTASAAPADICISVHEAPDYRLEADFRIKPPEPGKSKIKEEYAEIDGGRVVRKRTTGMLFMFGGGENLAVGPCRDNLNQVVNFINNRYIEWLLCRECLLGHAAGVLMNGNGLALAGFSGAGKSTLALLLMNAGATFVSNDRLMIENGKQGLIMHGVAKMPRINPGTALGNPQLRPILDAEEQRRFASLPSRELWELEHKYDVLIEDCYGPDRFVLQAAMKGLVILNWKRNGRPAAIQPVNLTVRRDLLPAFMKSVGLFFLPPPACRMPAPREETYIDFLSRCCILEISGGVDFAEAVRACLELAGSPPPGA